MCSIAGIISNDPLGLSSGKLEAMNHAMAHRGPDGEGYFQQQYEGYHVGFAHNRLAVIDLSNASAQPFRFMDRYVLVYNGEIYNHHSLRDELLQKGLPLRTTGDTEVLAASYAAWGKDCLQRLDGMFAFAIWDQQEQVLFCGRDRFGEKPFHYSFDGKHFCFASEIKGLLASGIQKEYDDEMLYQYLTLGYTKMPLEPGRTFFKGVYRLPPAHCLEYRPREQSVSVQPYWDLDKETISTADPASALEGFSERFRASLSSRMLSDVPIGTSLSGGVDSSSIVAGIHGNAYTNYSGHAFSAIFPGFERDESDNIRQLVARYGVQWETVSPDGAAFASAFKKVLHNQDEPFGSASIFAQWCVYALAKEKGVTVLLDGQGADEVLCGYTRYTHWYLQERVRRQGWAKASEEAQLFRQNGFLHHWGWKNRIAAYFPGMVQSQLVKKATRQQRSNKYIANSFADALHIPVYKPLVEKLNDIQYHDLMMDGLEELLRYADRNSMAHGREVRLPYLQHEMVQYVLSLPSCYRMNKGYTKWILREMMKDRLPADICWQKGKIGFEPPQQQWMQHPDIVALLQEARGILVKQNICTSSLLDKPIHAAGAHDANNFDFRCLVAGHWLADKA